MTRSQVEDERGCLKIWQVAANVSNKESLTVDKFQSINLGVGNVTLIPSQ